LLRHGPHALSLCKKKTIAARVRVQVVIARPQTTGAGTPRPYRRSFVSKGRFAISISVICVVGIRSGLPKRRHRVVVDYVGGPLHHHGKAGCRLFRGSWHVCEFGKTASCLWVFVVVAGVIDHEAALLDPKLFSSLVHRSVVLLKRRFGRQRSSRWPVALLAKS
jgi:hypothetical protein